MTRTSLQFRLARARGSSIRFKSVLLPPSVQWIFSGSAGESSVAVLSSRGSGRISQAFAHCESEGTRALIAYVTAGDPSPDRSASLIRAVERGGADIIELGVPFSDPIADGPMIQRASERALRSGTTVRSVLKIVRELRKISDIPVVVFSYLNPILRYGFERFADDASNVGVDGALLTDLNIEEADQYVAQMRARGLDCVFLVTQTTPSERIVRIANYCSGFVYVVSRAGVTGVRSSMADEALPLLRRTRKTTSLPLAIGFGLSRKEHMEAVAPHAEGAVVGSAFMRVIERYSSEPSLESKLESLARVFKQGLVLKR